MEQLLIGLFSTYPHLMALASAVGTARLIMVPLMQAIRLIVKVTPTKADDVLLAKFDESQLKKAVIFAVDYLASLNLSNLTGGK